MNLSPYQNLLLYYERLQQSYGWTMQEVDEHDIDFLLDQLMVLSLTDGHNGQKYIDDVLPTLCHLPTSYRTSSMYFCPL